MGEVRLLAFTWANVDIYSKYSDMSQSLSAPLIIKAEKYILLDCISCPPKADV